jgi:hypothetical protein
MRKPDLAKARRDLRYFSRLVAWSLTDWQADSLALDPKVTYVVGPRQSGKSRSVAVLAAWWAYRNPDQHAVIVSAGELGAKRLLALVADLVTSSPYLAASVVDEQTSLIRLTNGSAIRSLPASAKAIRGWPVDLLVIDEATEIDDPIIDVALPTTAARPDGRIVFCSTGGAPVGRAYETFMAGMDPRSTATRSFTWRLKDAKWLSKAFIEQERASKPRWVFEAEYEGVWATSTDALFPPDLLKRCTADLDLPDFEGLQGPARILGGVDWGDVGADQTVVIAIARVQSDRVAGSVPGQVYVAWPLRVFPPGTEVTEAAREIAWGSDAHFQTLSYETNGIGAGASQLLRDEIVRRDRMERRGADRFETRGRVLKVNPTITTWERKAQALGRTRNMAESGQLVFQREEHFLRQLATIRVEHRPQSVGIEGPPGGHDDFVMAAYLASGAVPTRAGEDRNVLFDLAGTAQPDPRLPEPDDWIEVGALRLPKRPDLISVAGPEVRRAPRKTIGVPGEGGWRKEFLQAERELEQEEADAA